MFELILTFLFDVLFYKIGCWSLRVLSFGKLKWDSKGQGNPYLMTLLGFTVFLLVLIIVYYTFNA